ncbi:hypothetical protein B296_00001396 [Ensete ventricosum]|uniref:Uncharacterized protein n=1 Tax=Ensete ventricosum TaxID=4639 RepID=A0A427BC49_ENSVE|nr:hypothetical protein B296_00001396 [Ensete ventricosum]
MGRARSALKEMRKWFGRRDEPSTEAESNECRFWYVRGVLINSARPNAHRPYPDRLIGSLHSLCHAASRPLSGALQASRLIVPHGQSPTIKSAVGRAASRPLSGALQASWPIASALPHGQPPTIKGVAGWSARRVCSAMPPTTHCQGRCRWVSLLRLLYQANSRVVVLSDARGQVSYGSVGTLHLLVVFAKARLASDVHPTWRHCDVAERRGRGGGVMF